MLIRIASREDIILKKKSGSGSALFENEIEGSQSWNSHKHG